MSEDYKKIALEDVKEGQKVRIVTNHRTFMSTYEGVVSGVDPEETCISFGSNGGGKTLFFSPISDTTILLLEDVPEPKVVRTTTVKYYDDGTKEETVMVPMEIKTMEQFYSYEDYLKTATLRDKDGDLWRYDSESWAINSKYGTAWLSVSSSVLEEYLPLTVVGDYEVD